MARQRYQRILEAAQYYAAIDNYIKYVTDSTKRNTRVGQGDPRPESQVLYLKPFQQALSADQRVKVSCSKPTWTAVSGIAAVNTRVSATAPADAGNIIKLDDFRAARVIYVTGRSANGVAKTSAVTGLKYLSYGGKSTSFPFGTKTGDNEEGAEKAAFEELKTAVLGQISGAIVTHQKERV